MFLKVRRVSNEGVADDWRILAVFSHGCLGWCCVGENGDKEEIVMTEQERLKQLKTLMDEAARSHQDVLLELQKEYLALRRSLSGKGRVTFKESNND